MTYQGTIKNISGRPLSAASVVFTDDQGGYVVTIPVNSSGQYSFDSDFDAQLLEPGYVVTFSAPGFHPYSINSSSLQPNFTVTLVSRSDAKALAIGAGVAAGAVLLLSKKKKVAGFGNVYKGLPPWAKGVVVIGGSLAAYMLVNRLFKSDESKKLEAGAEQGYAEAVARGIQPTLSQSTLELMSQQITSAAAGAGTDEPAIYQAFRMLNNEADFWLLIKKFGVRSWASPVYGTDSGNLSELLTSELTWWERSPINDILADIGVNYKF